MRIRESKVTPEALFLRRREFLRAAAAVSLVAAGCLPGDEGEAKSAAAPAQGALANVKTAPAGSFRATDEPTPYEDATTYNNFYEFGTDKEDPRERGQLRRAVAVAIEASRAPRVVRSRRCSRRIRSGAIYRLRCVEAWSW